MKKITEIPKVPSKNIASEKARMERIQFLESIGHDLSCFNINLLKSNQVRNNIECYLGTIEIPTGLIGPLAFCDENKNQEFVFSGLATTEGALVASVNRGVRAINESGGFKSRVIHQKMHRTPLFAFEDMDEAYKLCKWIKNNFEIIKLETKKYSNHANLIELNTSLMGKNLHVQFVYETGDASGQNMTTTCTWNTCQFILKQIKEDLSLIPSSFLIEANGSSDKKVSAANMINGRGTRVVCDVFLEHAVIEKVLKSTAKEMFDCYHRSITIAKEKGMIGYNLNVANLIAGIFAATGQDLGSVYESSNGLLQMELREDGLYVSLVLTNLLIGTIGGGTSLLGQSQVLSLMGCQGSEKSKRFAQIISGFALGLELSTMAAITSGQFAIAHERLGRNKPVSWLLRNEIDQGFIQNMLDFEIQSSKLDEKVTVTNGIITEMTKRVSNKLIGFIPVSVKAKSESLDLLIKSKALDLEVLSAFKFLANAIDPKLAKLFSENAQALEYNNSHIRELRICKFLAQNNFKSMPKFYGLLEDSEREIYLLLEERLHYDEFKLINSENRPTDWSVKDIESCIDEIKIFHALSKDLSVNDLTNKFKVSANEQNTDLFYHTLLNILIREYKHWPNINIFKDLQREFKKPCGDECLVHND
ncbi:MAG: hydroxymethylglutaryl-CoA reductase (NADPH), partial [Thermoproteota archaeon]